MAKAAARRTLQLLEQHQTGLRACKRCPQMIGPVVHGAPVLSKVMLIGQAPGPREGSFGRPFAWTAGKRLFEWLGTLGLDEEQVRARVYISAVCRCFPGKQVGKKPAGDRVPAPDEIENCAPFIRREIELLEPDLLIPIGRLAARLTSSRCPTRRAPRPGSASSRARR